MPANFCNSFALFVRARFRRTSISSSMSALRVSSSSTCSIAFTVCEDGFEVALFLRRAYSQIACRTGSSSSIVSISDMEKPQSARRFADSTLHREPVHSFGLGELFTTQDISISLLAPKVRLPDDRNIMELSVEQQPRCRVKQAAITTSRK